MKLLLTLLLLIPSLSWGNEKNARELYVKAKSNFLQNGCDFEKISNELVRLLSETDIENIKQDSFKDNLGLFLDCAYFYRDETLPAYQEIIDKYPSSEVAYQLMSSNEYISEKILNGIISFLEQGRSVIEEKKSKTNKAITSVFNSKDILSDQKIDKDKLSQPYIVHFFASWSKPSQLDIVELLKLKKKNIDVIGVIFRDEDFNFIDFNWNEYGGNPYKYIIKDNGEIAYEFELVGLPETFILADGKIKQHIKNVLDDEFANTFSYRENIDELLSNTEINEEEINSEPLTVDEIQKLQEQLYSCLTIPAGTYELDPTKVVINILVNRDRTIKQATLIDKIRFGSDKNFRTAAEAAMRAVNSPKCSTLNLPQNKYNQWKEINFTFDFQWLNKQ